MVRSHTYGLRREAVRRFVECNRDDENASQGGCNVFMVGFVELACSVGVGCQVGPRRAAVIIVIPHHVSSRGHRKFSTNRKIDYF